MWRIISRCLRGEDDVEMTGAGPERGRQVVHMQIDRGRCDAGKRPQTAFLFSLSARGITE